MCIIADEIKRVANTNIFVAPNTTKTRQLVIYSNSVVPLSEKNAMIVM